MRFEDAETIKSKGEARSFAIAWQKWIGKKKVSWGEVIRWQQVFYTLSQKFKLVKEFKENGII